MRLIAPATSGSDLHERLCDTFHYLIHLTSQAGTFLSFLRKRPSIKCAEVMCHYCGLLSFFLFLSKRLGQKYGYAVRTTDGVVLKNKIKAEGGGVRLYRQTNLSCGRRVHKHQLHGCIKMITYAYTQFVDFLNCFIVCQFFFVNKYILYMTYKFKAITKYPLQTKA